jgi:hypothetical protein
LSILYLFFRLEGYFKIIPLVITILSDILLYPMVKSPIATIINLFILLAFLEISCIVINRSF